MTGYKATNPQQSYLEYQARFAKLCDQELINLKKTGKNNPGWTSTRAAYERALTEEIAKRGLKLQQ